MPKRLRHYLSALLGILLGCMTQQAHAQADDDFFRGETITIYVSFPPGGGYDFYGRLVARHLGRHLPGNPTVIVSNMPGAQGLVCANYLFNVAPNDGTALAVLNQNVAQDQVLGTPGLQYDAAKFSWIGRVAPNIEILYLWHKVGVKSLADLKHRETILAADGTAVNIISELLKMTVGARFKLILGYRGTREVHLALQRGEVEGAVSSVAALRLVGGDWLKTKMVNVVVQNALERQSALPDVPTTVELAKTAEDKQVLAFFAGSGVVGRSIAGPPGIAPERLRMLQVPVKNPHSTMLWPEWVVLIAGSTGSALRAVRPPNLHITPRYFGAISSDPQRGRIIVSLAPSHQYPGHSG